LTAVGIEGPAEVAQFLRLAPFVQRDRHDVEADGHAPESRSCEQHARGEFQAPTLGEVDPQFGRVSPGAPGLHLGDDQRPVHRIDRKQVDLEVAESKVAREQAVAQPCEKGRGGGFGPIAECASRIDGSHAAVSREGGGVGSMKALFPASLPKPMAIVILEHSADCPADILIDSLRAFGQRMRVVKLHAGAPVPGDLDDTHGVVSLGGPQTVHEMNAPWMQAEMGLLRDAHGAGVPVLGLCLGAQLLAAALGGETGRMAAAEVGWKEVSVTPQGREDALLAGQPWKVRQFCWHSDEVRKLPDGATLLASSAACKVQAYAVGLRSYGIQYHPEWNAATVRREIETGTASVKAAGESVEQQLALTAQHDAASERLARRFFEACSLLLMPADRLNKGIVKDLHH